MKQQQERQKLLSKKKIISIVLVLALLIAYIPLNMRAGDSGIIRVADASTMDSWEEIFNTKVITTENAGKVWTDKSVFTDANAFAGTGIAMNKENNFLVALSAIASNIVKEGMTGTPTDTMLILDVSGSMNSSNSDVAEELVDSANESIKELLTVNKYNRVGVVLYSGPTTVSGAASDSDAVLVLPLGRYTTGSDGKYLSYKSTNNSGETISLDSDVKYEGANNGPESPSKKVVGATYIQKGIILAMNQFTASSNTTTVTDDLLGTLKRKPIMVLMSDGAPTISSVNFTNPTSYQLGDGSSSSTGQGFLTQLSAAYAKYQIEDKYDTESLFYTLGLATSSDSIATSVLNPGSSTTAINDFWSSYQKASVNGTVTVSGSGYNAKKVTKISAPLEQNYVDKYFQVDKNGSSSLADGLKNAFQEIIGNIELQSKYYPTLISKDEQYSGYITFEDRIGEYMNVKDVKGILINNTLYSGAELASNFAQGKDALGIYGTSIENNEMIKSVQNRLGIADLETARTLIKLAHNAGQLSYKNANEYSNYIGWYANEAGEFLGFYQDGVTKLQATSNSETNPVYTVKSYGYFGAVDEEQGVADTDMMFATVQVQTNISTGEQTVKFAVPAALVPILTYNVSFNENAALSGLTVTGADHPIRLVYEVGLEDGINSFNVKDMISADYAAANTNSDGSINFYTNQYDVSNTAGVGMINTYSYFNPSRQNEKYYFMIDTLIYADNKGTLYSGNSKPSGDMYQASVVYKKDGNKLTTETLYRKLDASVLQGAVKKTGTTNWYIPEGYAKVITEGSIVDKSVNKTNTLGQSTISFVDTSNHEPGDLGYDFYAVSTLGNNGKLTMEPETGIVITKEMKDGVSAPDKSFTFIITNVSDSRDNSEYPAYFVATDGKAVETSVVFQNGTATVTLKPGEELYIGGMTAGDVIRVVEAEEENYLVESVNGNTSVDYANITLVAHQFGEAHFVNGNRGKGNLTVEKDIVHNFGKDYEIPTNKTFTMTVTLQGPGTKNATYSASLTNSSISSITTDANGRFNITLRYNQQFALYNLPEGTQVTVVENNPGTGFAPTYKDNGVAGDGVVIIQKDATASVVVTNSYTAAPVSPTSVKVSGTKTLTGRPWQADDVFTFELQKQIGDNQWTVIGTATVKGSDTNKTFDFNDVFAQEVYSQIGTYHYRVVEVEPSEGALGGVTYDKHVHTFAVDVTDADMDGKLEVASVWTTQASTSVKQTGTNDWLVITDFTNRYSTNGNVAVTIDVFKYVINNSNSPLPYRQEFTFGLYGVDGTLVQESEAVTNGEGTRLILEYNQAGTYQYILKEVHPSVIPAGWTYTDKEVSVTVEVTDTGKGYLEAVIYKGADRPNNAITAISEDFTNIYQPKPAELIIDFVDKEISGRELKDKEFTFELQNTDGSTILTGTNDKNGNVNFNGTLTFDQVGTYNYQVVETSTDGKGVTIDKSVYHIVVTVSDQGGALRASHTVASSEGNRAVFYNTYKAQNTTYTIIGNKILSGRPLLNDEFTFIMKEVADANGTALSNAKVYETTNLVDGSFAFEEITYEAAGIYYYQVSEVIGSGNSHGITYDKTIYIVVVTITDNKEGKLVVTDVSYTTPAGKADQIIFRNTYVPSPTSAQIPGDKDLTGKVLLEDDFQFEIYVSDANWQTSTLLETVANAADGTFVFTAINYDKVGSYYYLVKEVNGGKVIDGITYDAAIYHVRIDVVDNLEGNLSSTVHIYDAYDVPQESIVFRNVYAISGTGSVTLEGEKILVGRDIVDGEFTFELYDADTEFVIADSVKDTATNTGNTFAFTLTYSPEDIGKTFHYVVKEANSGKVVDGIRYSADRYHIVVVVEDNGVGGIKTTKVITRDEISVTDLTFTNECVGNLVIKNEVEYYKENVKLDASLDGREDVEYTITVEFDNGTKETFTLKDGESKLFENILYGTTYKVTEDTTGAVYTNTITNGEGVIDSPVTNVDVLNRYDYYPVNPGFLLIKMDKDATKLLEGAIFGLYEDAECTIEVAQIESNAEGQMFFTVPDAGTYYLKEIQAPEGYLLSDEVYEVTAQYKYTEIFPTEEGESTTPYIEQRITVEIEGLELNEGKFEITAYNVTNDPIPPKPPVDDPIKNTGDSIVLQILALSLLLAGMAVVVTATRLRRKETTK